MELNTEKHLTKIFHFLRKSFTEMGYEHLKKGNEHLKKGNEHLKNGVEHLKKGVEHWKTLKNIADLNTEKHQNIYYKKMFN